MGVDRAGSPSIRCAPARSRSTARWILPVAVFGSSSRTRTRRGRLKPARRPRQCSISASGSSLLPRHRDDAGNRLDEAVGAGGADDDGLEHVGVLDQHGLDLGRSDPLAADLEHVVGASQVGVEAVLGLDVHVAALEPLAVEALAGRIGAAPVAGRRGGARDPELPRRARGHVVAGLVAETDAVPAHHRARRPGPAASGTVRDVDVGHLRRADPVEDLDAEALAEAREQLGRERLPGGDSLPYRRERVRGEIGGQQRGVERRHGEEQRRPALPHDLGDPGRPRAAGRAPGSRTPPPTAGSRARCRGRRRGRAGRPRSSDPRARSRAPRARSPPP